MEMARRGKRGKPTGGFPSFPPPRLGIARGAIPTFPQGRRIDLPPHEAPCGRLNQ